MTIHHERVPLVGRDAELEELRVLLSAHSPVTVVGPGGVGKTRLAAAVAADPPWDDGATAQSDLAGITDATQVADSVAEALGFPSLDAAAVGCADGRRLLLLDSCDHVVDAAAVVVERLAAECPGITVLATSREPLDVPGEHVLALGTLPLPTSDDRATVERSPAVRLFLDRAAAAGSPPPRDEDWAAVAALCRCLDGLPLALELAAARSRSLTPAEIAAHLADRLDVLARRRHRGPARHRSLEATIEWSYDRLDEPAQRVFARLGVFRARFSAASARAVAGGAETDLVAFTDDLDHLVTQSLLTVERRAGRSWYGMLDTLRAFARSRLAARGELDAVLDRWADSLADVADGLVATGTRAGSLDAWVTVSTVQGDLFAALRRCVEADEGPERAVRLFGPLWWVAYNARAEPVAEIGDRVLARWADRDGAGCAEVAAVTAFAHVVLGAIGRGQALAEGALAGSRTPSAAVIAHRALAAAAHAEGRDDDALRHAELAIADAAGLDAWRHELEALRAFLLGGAGRIEEAVAQARAARDGAAALGSPTLLAWTTLAHGCLVALRDPEAGRAVLTPLAAGCRAVGDGLGEGRTLRALGAVAALDGDVPEAVQALRAALDAFARIGHAAQIRATLRWVALLAAGAGHPAVCASLHRAIGTAPSPVSDVLDRVHASRLSAAAPTTATPTSADGAALSLRDAVRVAREELDAITAEQLPGVAARVAWSR